MSGTYNRNGGELTPRRPDDPHIFEHKGRQYVGFNGYYYTYDQWKEMERKFSDSTDT